MDFIDDMNESEQTFWARDWQFGDSRYSTRQFVETWTVRAPKEIGCAFAASFLVSPLVSIIDKCVVNVTSTRKLLTAMGNATTDMIVAPSTFFGSKAFTMTFAVYFGTYTVANLSEVMLDRNRVTDDERRKALKVSAASAANISLLAWRDTVFARDFGGGQAKRSTPMRTIGLFAARDSLTMYATFYVAPVAAEYLIKNHGVERNTAELSMALGIPMIAQFVTAPLHIHAMDFYNKPTGTFATRMAVINKEMPTVCFARGLRILPAFGIGSFSNNKFRELFIRQTNEEKLLGRRVTRFLEKHVTRRSTQDSRMSSRAN